MENNRYNEFKEKYKSLSEQQLLSYFSKEEIIEFLEKMFTENYDNNQRKRQLIKKNIKER